MTEYMFIDYKIWGDIMHGLVSQINRLKKMSGIYDFTHVYAPPRGGWPIAVHLSHHLDLTLIVDFEIFVDGDELNSKTNILTIDDIVDTGKTFNEINKIYGFIIDDLPTFQYKFASIHYKPRAIIKPDIYLQEVPNDTWVVYPWERCDEREKEKLGFEERRFDELRDEAIKTGKPIMTATQKAVGPEGRLIWRSFLNADT